MDLNRRRYRWMLYRIKAEEDPRGCRGALVGVAEGATHHPIHGYSGCEHLRGRPGVRWLCQELTTGDTDKIWAEINARTPGIACPIEVTIKGGVTSALVTQDKHKCPTLLDTIFGQTRKRKRRDINQGQRRRRYPTRKRKVRDILKWKQLSLAPVGGWDEKLHDKIGIVRIRQKSQR